MNLIVCVALMQPGLALCAEQLTSRYLGKYFSCVKRAALHMVLPAHPLIETDEYLSSAELDWNRSPASGVQFSDGENATSEEI